MYRREDGHLELQSKPTLREGDPAKRMQRASISSPIVRLLLIVCERHFSSGSSLSPVRTRSTTLAQPFLMAPAKVPQQEGSWCWWLPDELTALHTCSNPGACACVLGACARMYMHARVPLGTACWLLRALNALQRWIEHYTTTIPSTRYINLHADCSLCHERTVCAAVQTLDPEQSKTTAEATAP